MPSTSVSFTFPSRIYLRVRGTSDRFLRPEAARALARDLLYLARGMERVRKARWRGRARRGK